MGDPLPNRPTFSQEMNPNPPFPQEQITQEFHYPKELQLPNPTKSMNISSHDLDRPKNQVRFSESVCCESSTPSSSKLQKIQFSPPTGKTPKGEKETVDELLLILVEVMDELNTRSRESLLRKFFSEIERDDRLESFIVERLKQSRVKAISELFEKLPRLNDASTTVAGANDDDSTSTRSLHESVAELSQELERFKIKTLDLGTDVQEEVRK